MAITTLDGVIAAARQRVNYVKTASITSVAGIMFSTHHLAGNPGAGTLAGGNTANGVVPTDATAGFPLINAFGGSNSGYLTGLQFSSSVACNLVLYDRLFVAAAYSFNSNVTLATQPSYSSRVPGGTDFSGLELWVETVTAFTGNLSVAVTYTNESGVTGHTTGTVATGIAPTVGRIIQLPLAAGDTGIQKIESVVASVSTVGTFNLVIARRLATMRIPLANYSDQWGFDRTGMPQVWANSALAVAVQADSTATGLPFVCAEIRNG